MSELTVIGNVPNTDLFWEKSEYDAWTYPDGKRLEVRLTDYILVKREWSKRRRVLANLDMGQLVALRASIDALLAAEAEQES